MKQKKKVEKKPKKEKVDKNDPLNILIKKFGSEIIRIAEGYPKVEVIPVKSISVNWVLGCGGFPRGRIVEIFGPESSGKTTLCYDLIATVQAAGGRAGLVDVENSLDKKYVEKCGVNLKKLVYAQPDYAEQALDIARSMVGTEQFDVVILDSIGAMIPKAELEGKMTDRQVGLLSVGVTKFVKMMNTELKGTKCCLVLTNQLRDLIGGGGGFAWGPQTKTPGGRALKHHSAVRLEVKRTKTLKTSDRQIGFLTKFKVVKNKVAPPFRQIEIPILYNIGIDYNLDFINLALECKAITKSKSMFYFRKKLLGNGWREAVEYILKREKLKMIITEKIDAMLEKHADLGIIDDDDPKNES